MFDHFFYYQAPHEFFSFYALIQVIIESYLLWLKMYLIQIAIFSAHSETCLECHLDAKKQALGLKKISLPYETSHSNV